MWRVRGTSRPLPLAPPSTHTWSPGRGGPIPRPGDLPLPMTKPRQRDGQEEARALTPPFPAIVLGPQPVPTLGALGSRRHKGCRRGRSAPGQPGGRAAGWLAGVEAPELSEPPGLDPECPGLDAAGTVAPWAGSAPGGAEGVGQAGRPVPRRGPALPPRSPWGLPAAPPIREPGLGQCAQPWSHPMALGTGTPPP